MTHRRVTANALEYDFAPDDPPLLAHRDWAVVTAQVVDEIEDAPIRVPFRVRVLLPGAQDEVAQDGTRVHRIERGITVKTGAEGTFALVTRPWLRFTPLGLPPSITVEVEAAGFVTLRRTFGVVYDQRTIAGPALAAGDVLVTLNSSAGLRTGQTLLFGPATVGPPAGPQYVRILGVGPVANQVTLMAGVVGGHIVGDVVFPDTFTSPPSARIAMRRRATRIVGRVVNRHMMTNVITPINNAQITLVDFWRTRASVIASPNNGAMTDPNPLLRQFAVSLAPGTLVPRAAGANVDFYTVNAIAGDDKQLTQAAQRESTTLAASDRVNLSIPPALPVNRVVQIEPDEPERAEFQTVAAVDGVGVPQEPARVTLDAALRHTHADGARVVRINAVANPPVVPAITLRDAAEAGDRCVFVNGLAGVLPNGTLRLTGGGAIEELQQFSQVATATNADGYFRIPAIQRMARVALSVDDGAGNVQTIEMDPDYGESEQRLDVVYPL